MLLFLDALLWLSSNDSMHNNFSGWLRPSCLIPRLVFLIRFPAGAPHLPLKLSALLCLLVYLITLVSSCAHSAGCPGKALRPPHLLQLAIYSP